MINIHKTKYYGIDLLEEDGYWWLRTDCGCADYYGKTKPSQIEIDNYANSLRY